ncbi:hypothetical protein [Pseudomonas sp. 2995-1]|uniref:hypothetical protein n=1 Tax=Pseudomonas sp. 2995-1 TaxID=1712679 RepID=UPI000C145ABB|nr:hypothetical protein [Pseudomonas sp. 2995-1]
MKRLIMLGVVAASLSGCLDKDDSGNRLIKAVESVVAIEVANNSPDAAVKSWWHIKDMSRPMYTEFCKHNQKVASPYFSKLSQLAASEFIDEGECGSTPPLTFDRQITKVEVQSDTRAVVLARIKNTTPPDPGAVLDADAKKTKEAGEPFQYVLERKDVNSGWKITKVSSMPSYAKDWRDAYPKSEPSNNRFVYGSFQ